MDPPMALLPMAARRLVTLINNIHAVILSYIVWFFCLLDRANLVSHFAEDLDRRRRIEKHIEERTESMNPWLFELDLIYLYLNVFLKLISAVRQLEDRMRWTVCSWQCPWASYRPLRNGPLRRRARETHELGQLEHASRNDIYNYYFIFSFIVNL